MVGPEDINRSRFRTVSKNMLNLAEMELDNLTYAHAHFKTINNNAQTQPQQ